MNAFYTFMYDILSVPFGWILYGLYTLLGNNYFLALTAFTIIAKLILIPSTVSTQKNQAKTLRTRAKIEKIRQKYAGDQVKMNEEIQAFYAKEGYGSMTAGCGTLLIQFPLIMGLYGAIYKPLSYICRIPSETVDKITAAVKELGLAGSQKNNRVYEILAWTNREELKASLKDIPESVWDSINSLDYTAFGLNLGVTPSDMSSTSDYKFYLLVPIAAFITAMASSIYSYIRSKQTTPDAANNASMGCMMLFMPFMSLWLAYSFPIGIGIYWAINSILSLIQMIVINKIYEPKKVIAKMMIDETNERRANEAALKENYEILANKN